MKILLLSIDTPREITESLSALGYKIFALPRHEKLPTAIASHPDSLVFRGKDRIILDEEYYLKNRELFSEISSICPTLRIDLSSDTLSKKYPYDARLNAISLGKRLFCKAATISRKILDYADDYSLEVIDTKQGYPACSTLKITENAVICADGGLAKTYRSCGITVYEIASGGISLPPYEYGFIGGASVRIEGTICFFGDLASHPSERAVYDTLRDYSLSVVSLGGGILRDLGGGILL